MRCDGKTVAYGEMQGQLFNTVDNLYLFLTFLLRYSSGMKACYNSRESLDNCQDFHPELKFTISVHSKTLKFNPTVKTSCTCIIFGLRCLGTVYKGNVTAWCISHFK